MLVFFLGGEGPKGAGQNNGAKILFLIRGVDFLHVFKKT